MAARIASARVSFTSHDFQRPFNTRIDMILHLWGVGRVMNVIGAFTGRWEHNGNADLTQVGGWACGIF